MPPTSSHLSAGGAQLSLLAPSFSIVVEIIPAHAFSVGCSTYRGVHLQGITGFLLCLAVSVTLLEDVALLSMLCLMCRFLRGLS